MKKYIITFVIVSTIISIFQSCTTDDKVLTKEKIDTYPFTSSLKAGDINNPKDTVIIITDEEDEEEIVVVTDEADMD
ncbi:hypothetical protein [Aquimarina sp. AU58]|uniref:hypothetical protein n=1 Tax=Aquimarina sp. AU58 TaxID=1874112 RepID=UPI000D64FC73|nr:hypothetical protein [Aquimarina sp. AU58]